MVVCNYMRLVYSAIIALIAFAVLIQPLQAQDITLTSNDGKVSIQGTLQAFDGEFYRINSIYGAMTLERSAVTCDGAGCPDLENYVAEFTLSGALPMGELLMPLLVENFAKQSGMDLRRNIADDLNFSYNLQLPETGKTVARIIFRISNTDIGFSKLLAGETDMVLATREITTSETKAAKKAGLGNLKNAARSRIVALDALVPVVAMNNSETVISIADLAQIFAGKIDNWQQIGGPDAPIYVHLRTASSGLAQQFEQLVMATSNLASMPTLTRHQTAADLVDAVAADPFAIGITRFSELGSAKMLAIKGACGMNFQANVQSLKTEDYPLSAPLFLYTPARRLPKIAREFLTYLGSPAAQRVVRTAGFVDQRIGKIPIHNQGRRFANAIAAAGQETRLTELQRMIGTLQIAERITPTFRFEAGSVKLDAQSRANVILLARHLEAGKYEGRELLFVGFSDGMGEAEINRKISKRRASAVKAAVVKAADTLKPKQQSMRVEAFGEAMPMACDDTDWGRQVNRRVEVWVK